MANEMLFTVKEVAERKLLGYGQRMIRQLIKDGKLRTIDLSEIDSKQRTIRIPESAIHEFLESKKS